MASPTRRSFVKNLVGGLASASIATIGGQAGAMPGRPSNAPDSSKAAMPVRTMSIAAHPGDAFFAMGAPVALAVHQGASGCLLSLTLGENGSSTVSPREYGQFQRIAAEKAAARIGAKAEFLAFSDGELPPSEEAKLAVCDLLRQYKPQVVVTHWKGSWHKDHRACYEIVQDATFYAALPGIKRKFSAHTVGKLFFDDNWEDANGFLPDTYLDISPVYGDWLDACAAFPMWRGENGFRYNDYYSSLAVARGCVANFAKAVALMSSAEQNVRHVRML